MSDAAVKGILPSLIPGGMAGIGAAIDSTCGWLTCGLFTMIGYCWGSSIRNTIRKEQLEENIGGLRRCFQQLTDRKTAASKTIATSVQTNLGALPRLIQNAPNIMHEPQIQGLLPTAQQHIAADTQQALTDTQTILTHTTAAIPYNVFNKMATLLLGIDLRGVAVCHYEAAADAVRHRIGQAKIEADLHAQYRPHQALTFMLDTGLYREGQSGLAISSAMGASNALSASFMGKLASWSTGYFETWQAGSAVVMRVAKDETGAVNTLHERLKPSMRDYRTKVRASLARMGKNPDLCPL